MPYPLKWLQYYVSSTDFQLDTNSFMEAYGHLFEPIPGPPQKDGTPSFYEWNIPYFCESEIYKKYEEKLDSCQGYPGLNLSCKSRDGRNAWSRLTPKFLHPYFTAETSPEQVFTLCFGLWWGLYLDQIILLAQVDSAHTRSALNYFICNPEECTLPPNLSTPYYHRGRYKLWLYGTSNEKSFWVEDFNPWVSDVSSLSVL